MRKFFCFLAVILFCLAPDMSAQAEGDLGAALEGFETLPIQHNGRIMPLKTFAYLTYEALDDNVKIEGRDFKLDPVRWLVKTVFMPQSGAKIPVIGHEHKLMSFEQAAALLQKEAALLNEALSTPPAQQADEQRTLIKLFNKTERLRGLLNAFENASRIPIIPDYQFRVIPQDPAWLSPAKAEASAILDLWTQARDAFAAQDVDEMRAAFEALFKETSAVQPRLETAYQTSALLHWAFISAIAAAFLYMFSPLGGFIAIMWGAAFIILETVLRILITARLPIGTLSESILFVVLIFFIFALFIKTMRVAKRGGFLAVVIAALIAAALYFQSPDPLKPLEAVLNTDFWLATHVVIITAGYAAALGAAMIAHGLLFSMMRGEKNKPLKRWLKPALILALALTGFGTALGGFWADQSWGRFWGWDPKENGALLITLWVIWLLHGAHTDQFSKLWFWVGSAYLSVIVALAWFGVNLLGAGLHSYGFISGIAGGLFTFIVAQTALLTLFVWRIKKS